MLDTVLSWVGRGKGLCVRFDDCHYFLVCSSKFRWTILIYLKATQITLQGVRIAIDSDIGDFGFEYGELILDTILSWVGRGKSLCVRFDGRH